MNKGERVIMKVKDIATKYGFDPNEFEKFLDIMGAELTRKSKFGFVDAYLEKDIEKYVQLYANGLEQAIQEKNRQEYERLEAINCMLVTSGDHFEGYKITQYSGYVGGDAILTVGRGDEGFFKSATDISQYIMNYMPKLRAEAVYSMKDSAYCERHANAIIGLDFDYVTMEPETASTKGDKVYLPYILFVSVSGIAVTIEKITSD